LEAIAVSECCYRSLVLPAHPLRIEVFA
jgi:hypothetical protein